MIRSASSGRSLSGFLSAALLLAPGGQALARTETVSGLLARARSQTDLGELTDTYSRAIALTHKAGDVLVEQSVSQAFSGFLYQMPWEVPHVPGADNLSLGRQRRDAFALILGRLDPKRSAAFVSAHALATQFLFSATKNADDRHVFRSLEVIEEFARSQRSSKISDMLALYGQGIVARASGRSDEAIGPLEQALNTCIAERWTDCAAYVGTELAAVGVERKNRSKARAALEAIASAGAQDMTFRLAATWKSLVDARLRGAPSDVLEPYAFALKPFLEEGSFVESLLPECACDPPGLTKLGSAWRDLSSARPIVTVLRTRDGFEIREGFDREFRAARSIAWKLEHFSNGGVVLAFDGAGVALLRLALEGSSVGPSEAPYPSLANSYYRLGVGESYSVSKVGLVTIARE